MSDVAGNEWLEAEVRQVTPAGRDTLLLQLAAPAGVLPGYRPGAHVAVECGAGVIRHYSLTGGGGHAGVYELGVKLAADTRGGSRWIFDHARPGVRLRISAPRDHFPLCDAAPGYLFLSGGIGLTPIVAMLHALRARNVRARLVHMCRAPDDLAFGDWLAELGRFHDVQLHFDATAGGVYDVQSELERAAADTEVYCCGPAGLMAAVQAFGERSGRAGHFHFEFFSAAEAPAPAGPEDEFVVIQASTGRRIPVPATKTMLAALRDAGLEMKSECEYGVCGWCAVGVRDGEPRHFDAYLTAAEKAGGKLVLPCVSRCASPTLTLDL